jgi:uncharacterized protein (TIRG00374 family)
VEKGRRHWWKVAASLVLAAGLLAWFLSRVPLGEVARRLTTVRLGWFGAAVLASLSSYALRALRWRVILRPLGNAPTGELLGCTAAGFATSAILPARAGELVRPLLLTARTRLPAAGTVASIVVERLADLATVMLMFGVSFLLSRHSIAAGALRPVRDAAALALAGVVVVFAVVMLLLRRREAAVRQLSRVFPGRLRPRGERLLHHLLDGLEAVRDPGALARLLGWSCAVWVASAVQVQWLARAFGLDYSLPVSFVAMAVSGLGLAVPTPGGVGGFHAAIQFALTSLLAVDLPTATGFAVLHQAVCFVPITIVGLSYMAAVGLSLSRVRALEEASTPTAGES